MSNQFPLSTRFKFLYSLGDIATSAPLSILTFYQLVFLTDVAGLRPLNAGTAILLGKLWDAVNDPMMGLLSDRIRSDRGRRRIVLLFASIPFGLSYLLQFLTPQFSELGKTVYYAAVLILFDTLYTAVHVSYNALTPELTKDYDERSSLNGYRMAFSILGSLFGVILATILGTIIEDQRTLYGTLGVSVGLLSAVVMMIVFRVTEGYDSVGAAEGEEHLSVRESIQATVQNRPFLWFMGLFLFSWTTANLLGTTLVFFANYYLGVPEQANFFVLVAQTSAIAFIPFWVWMAKRFDKRRAFIGGSLSWIVVLFALASAGSEQIVLTYILAALGGAGISTAYFLPWAMIPDLVELDELKTGKRREGAFYSFAAFFQKLGTALAVWLLGVALEFRGYITPVTGEPLPVQPVEAVNAIRLAMGVVPAFLLIGAVICAYYYPITREVHQNALKQLAARTAAE